MSPTVDTHRIAPTWRVLATLAGKDLTLLFRDRFALFWVFGFPLLYSLFFGSIFASEHGSGGGAHARIRVAVVDRDNSPASRRLIERLAVHPSLQLVGESSDRARTFWAEEAEERVSKGDCAAFVLVPEGYGSSPFWLFGADAAATGGAAPFDIGIDPTRRAEIGMLQGVLLQTAFACVAEQIGDRDAMRTELQRAKTALRDADELASGHQLALLALLTALDRFLVEADPAALARLPDAVAIDDRLRIRPLTRRDGTPRSSFEVMFPSATIWGLMSVALSFAIMLVRERTQGTLLRLRTAPISIAWLLAGKALGCFLACVLSMLFLLAFGHLVLSVRIEAPVLALLAIGCTSLCFTGLMMAASVLGRSEQAVAGAAWGSMLPLAMIGGGMIPLVAMPPWLLALSDVSPFKWGIYALEGAVWRGFTPADMALPCGVLLVVGAVGFAIGVVVFRRSAA